MTNQKRLETLKEARLQKNAYLLDLVISDMEWELQGELLKDRPADVSPYDHLESRVERKYDLTKRN